MKTQIWIFGVPWETRALAVALLTMFDFPSSVFLKRVKHQGGMNRFPEVLTSRC